MLLKAFMHTPKDIYITPKITASFIFILFTKVRYKEELAQMGSTPKV